MVWTQQKQMILRIHRRIHRRIQEEEYKNTQKKYTKKINDSDNHEGVITHLEQDILEYEVK